MMCLNGILVEYLFLFDGILIESVCLRGWNWSVVMMTCQRRTVYITVYSAVCRTGHTMHHDQHLSVVFSKLGVLQIPLKI